jgi:hypothetical protein
MILQEQHDTIHVYEACLASVEIGSGRAQETTDSAKGIARILHVTCVIH